MFRNPESQLNRESFPQLWQRLEQLNRAVQWARENLPTDETHVVYPSVATEMSHPTVVETQQTVPYFDAKLAQMQERATVPPALAVLDTPTAETAPAQNPEDLDEQGRLLLEAWRYATPADEQLEWLRSVTNN